MATEQCCHYNEIHLDLDTKTTAGWLVMSMLARMHS